MPGLVGRLGSGPRLVAYRADVMFTDAPCRTPATASSKTLVTSMPEINPLTFYGHIITAEQRTIIQQYGDWYTGR